MRALSGDGDGIIRLYDLKTFDELKQFKGPKNLVTGLAFLDEDRALSLSVNGIFSIWELTTGNELFQRFIGYEGFVLHPAGKHVVAAGGRGLKLWRLPEGADKKKPNPDPGSRKEPVSDAVFKEHVSSVFCVAIDASGKVAASGDEAGEVILWDLERQKLLRRVGDYSQPISDLEFSEDGKYLFVTAIPKSEAKEPRRWRHALVDVHTGDTKMSSEKPDTSPPCDARLVSLAPFGTRLVTLTTFSAPDARNLLEITDFSKGEEDRKPKLVNLKTRVKKIALSPKGTHAVSSSGETQEYLLYWDIDSGSNTRFKTPALGVRSLAFAPDGKKLVSGGQGGTFTIWDVIKGQVIKKYSGHSGPVVACTFLPTLNRVLTASDDKTVRLWDLENGKTLQQFVGHEDAVRCVAVSGNGELAVSGGDDKTVRVWRLPKDGTSAMAEPPAVRAAITGVVGGPFRPGDKIVMKYQLFNPTDMDIDVPLTGKLRSLGIYQWQVEYLDRDGVIPGISPKAEKRGKLYELAGSHVGYKNTFKARAVESFQQVIDTAGFLPGRYKYYLNWKTPRGGTVDLKEISIILR